MLFPERQKVLVKYVVEFFVEESSEKKAEYCDKYGVVCLVMGEDHLGKFDWVTEATEGRCSVKYLEHTPIMSTTVMMEKAATIS